jgi:Tol biopolymer transport system component
LIAGAAVVVLAAAGAIWKTTRPAELDPPKIVTVTSFPGEETSPALSPDGKQVAFVWGGEKGDNRDIYVKLVDTGTPLRLTTDPAADISPAWSPDGRYVAFARLGKESGYYIVPSLGGVERKVADHASPRGAAQQPSLAWTPDGKFLIVPDSATNPACLTLVPLEGGAPKCLTSPPAGSFGDFLPSVAPDGSSIVFLRSISFAVGEYYLASWSNQTLGNITPFRKAEGMDLSPAAWTPDGSEVIMGASFAGQNTLIRLAPRPGAQPQLIPGIGDNSYQPSVARGGGRLAFSQGKSTLNIWRMPLDPKSDSLPQRVTATSRSDNHAELSPDGARIVFSSDRSGDIDIWVANANGSNPVQITSNLLRALRPRWSPDSRRIAFAARPGGNVDVYVVDAAGGPVRRLTTHPAEDASAQWSRDGRWVYFSSNRTGRRELWKIPSDGSTPEIQVTHNGGQISIESQDGGSLIFTKFAESGLFRMPVEGGPEEKISDAPTVNFDLAGDQLYFLSNQGRSIQRLDLSTRKVTDVVAADEKIRRGPSGFSVSRDAKWLFHTRGEQSEADIMLLDNFR